MPNCDYVEADPRIAVHVAHALKHGAKLIKVRANDTDVVVILVGNYHKLKSIQPEAVIFVTFGTGASMKTFNIGDISDSLGTEIAKALPVFHAQTGSDVTSFFRGKGKKTCWNVWMGNMELFTAIFVYIAEHPFYQITTADRIFPLFERFTVLLYDRSGFHRSLHETRQEIFCHRGANVDKLPPTQVRTP